MSTVMLRPSPDRACERARHEHARIVLERVLRDCSREGIDVLPVKGIVTARRLYSDPAERPIRDIDLRVRPEDLDRVRRIGALGGWRLLARSRAYGTLGFDVMGFLVEFESRVGPPGLCELPIGTMLSRALKRYEPFSVSHLEPEIHDHVLLLCVNAFKDKLIDAPAGAMRDLELLPRDPGFSVARLVALAVEMGVTNIVWIVANWFVDARSCACWRPIRAQLGLQPPRPFYALLFRWAVRAAPPHRRVLRVLARAGADRGHSQLLALTAAATELAARAIAPTGAVSRGPCRTTVRSVR